MNTSRVFGWATLCTASIAVMPAIGFMSRATAACPPCASKLASEVGKNPIAAARLTALMVLFLPWEDPTTPPLPTGDPKSGSGNNSNGSGGNNNTNKGPGRRRSGRGPDGPPDTGPGRGNVTSPPEPATLITGGLGLGMLLLARWRHRRGQHGAPTA